MQKELLAGIGIVVIVVLAIAFFTPIEIPTTKSTEVTNETKTDLQTISSNVVTINLPAVDNQGNGVIAKLKVQSIPGEGRILTNINQLLFWVDTQYSIRTAEMVSENITGKDLSKIDLIYTIETNASVIEGSSAGAALTIATIAVMEDKALNPDVMITGTINPDGTIGPVGSILAKAQASKELGAKLLLVPSGQGTQTNYIPEKTCEKTGPVTFCTIEYKPERITISEDAGIEVKEIATINEALKYFVS